MAKIPGSFQPNSPLKDTRNPLTPDEKKNRAEFLRQHQHKRSTSLTPRKLVKTEEVPIKTKKSESTEAKSSLNALFDMLAHGVVPDSDITKQVHGCFAAGAFDENLISAVLAERTTDDQTNIANAAREMKSSDDILIKKLMTAVHDVTEENLATQLKTAPAVEDLLFEMAKENPTKGEVSRMRELLLLTGDQLWIGREEEIRPRIKAALQDLTPQQTIAVASSFIKLDPSDRAICPMLGHEISAATSRAAPKYFIDECAEYRSPPIGALETMEKIELLSVDLTDAMYMHDFLNNAFKQALDGVSPDKLKRVHDRLNEEGVPKNVSVLNRFKRAVDKRLPQQPDLPNT